MSDPRKNLDDAFARAVHEIEQAREQLRQVMIASAPDDLRAAFEALAVRLDEEGDRQYKRSEDALTSGQLGGLASIAAGREIASHAAANEIRKVLNG